MTVPQEDGRKRVIIEGISPIVDAGRFPVKRTVGDQVRVEADIFTDGHDAIAASLLAHREGSEKWIEIPMLPLVNDRWTAAFRVAELGRYAFKVRGWVDHFETWHRDLLKRVKAESDTAVDYLIGADLIAAAAARAPGPDAAWLKRRAEILRSGNCAVQRVVRVLSPLHGRIAGQARDVCGQREAAALHRRNGLQRCVSAAHSPYRHDVP